VRSGQGALAPVAASAALFGTYLVLKWLPELNLQTLFNAYFWLVGAVAVAPAPHGAHPTPLAVPSACLWLTAAGCVMHAGSSATNIIVS